MNRFREPNVYMVLLPIGSSEAVPLAVVRPPPIVIDPGSLPAKTDRLGGDVFPFGATLKFQDLREIRTERY
jgi:hypothetical protein